MRFAVAPPGAVLPPLAAVPQPKRLATLGMTWKEWTAPGCYEVVKAVTADGEWLFERADDKTWKAGHLPTKTALKCRRSLRACRAYVTSGQALADLERLQSEGKENGDD